MKNKISKVFICFLVFNFVFLSNLSAAANISVSSVDAKVGEEITVDVNIKDNPGFVGYQIALFYDVSKLEYVSSTNGEVVEDKLAMISNNVEASNVKQVCVGKEIKENGKLMSVTFKIKGDVKDNQIPLELKVTELVNDVNGKAQNVEYTISNGNIKLANNKGNVISTEISSDKLNIIKAENGKISVKTKDDSISKRVMYRSTNESKAKVDENGNITTIAPGEVEIEALVDGEVIDTVTLNIPSVEEQNTQLDVNLENKDISKEKHLSKKYIIFFVIMLLLVVLAIFGIIYFYRKKGRKKNEEK